MPDGSNNGGLCGETFGSAGFLSGRFANPVQSVSRTVWRRRETVSELDRKETAMNDTTRHIDPAASLQDAITRIEEIGACWRAFADLLIPEEDMHIVGREDLAALFKFLSTTYAISETDSAEGRLEELTSCLTGIAAVLRPEGDIFSANRDKLATLVFRIADKQSLALDALREAGKGRGQP